jgi:hypothetical protein
LENREGDKRMPCGGISGKYIAGTGDGKDWIWTASLMAVFGITGVEP